MEIASSKKVAQKVAQFFCCEKCDYITSRKNNFDKHMLTRKHHSGNLEMLLGNKSSTIETTTFSCNICSKCYLTSSGLWKHKQKCHDKCEIIEKKENSNQDSSIIDNALVLKLIEQNSSLITQNQELQKQIIHISKEGKTINNINTNSINNSFNLNVFLNEKCKDALNISDFVELIKVNIHDLEETGKIGYVEGISKIFIKGLQELDVYKRPIHCSDLKREVLYVKENNTWEKEPIDKNNIKSAIKKVANKNIKQIDEWIKEHPKYNDYDHKDNTTYLELVSSSMIGNDFENDSNKIIRNIAKEVVIEK